MITNFEDITYELTPMEQASVSHIVYLLANSSTPVKNQKINQYLREQNSELNLDGSRIRKVISHIRVKKLLKNIIATSKGYHVSYDNKEIERYVKSLTERINAITAIKNSFAVL